MLIIFTFAGGFPSAAVTQIRPERIYTTRLDKSPSPSDRAWRRHSVHSAKSSGSPGKYRVMSDVSVGLSSGFGHHVRCPESVFGFWRYYRALTSTRSSHNLFRISRVLHARFGRRRRRQSSCTVVVSVGVLNAWRRTWYYDKSTLFTIIIVVVVRVNYCLLRAQQISPFMVSVAHVERART